MKLIEKYRNGLPPSFPIMMKNAAMQPASIPLTVKLADRRTTRWVIRRMARVFSIDLRLCARITANTWYIPGGSSTDQRGLGHGSSETETGNRQE